MGRQAELSRIVAVARLLAPSRLSVRGGFVVSSVDFQLPGIPPDTAAILLIGNGGGAFWPVFERWRQTQPADLANPLDTWSREIIDTVAKDVGAQTVYPSDKPHLPFQQWAMRAERLKPSPLGILMHPEFGVWHAYRGALLLPAGALADEVHALNQAARDPIHLCDLCVGKPCMKACPVNAHSGTGFAYQDCLDHVRGPDGEPCRTGGCLDRNACPYGIEYRYPPEMQAFIMRAFSR